MDGRKFKKPKKAPGRTVTSNATLHKVDLPKLKPGQTMIISPKQNTSQPTGIGKGPSTQSFGVPGKFVDPYDNRIRPKKNNPAPDPNTNSDSGFPLLDISIPNSKNPV